MQNSDKTEKQMKGTIEINRMRVYGFVGVGEQERTVGNTYEVTVHIVYPIANAMEYDIESQTLSYVAITEAINEAFSIQSFLLEHVVHLIRHKLLTRYPEISGGMIKVAKLTPPIAAQMESAAVSVEW